MKIKNKIKLYMSSAPSELIFKSGSSLLSSHPIFVRGESSV